MALLASVDQTRYILNGVSVEVIPDKGTLLIATDGRRLGVLRSNAEILEDGREEGATGIYWIPTSLIKSVPSSLRTAILTFEGLTVSIRSLGSYGMTYSEEISPGNYPNWRGLVPTGELVPAVRLGFNFELLNGIVAASRLISGSRRLESAAILLFQECAGDDSRTAQRPYIIRTEASDRFFAVLMPVLDPSPIKKAPSWLEAPQQKAA